MLALLADGKAHSKRELHALLDDELSGSGAVRRQLCEARKIARASGGEIVCERVIFYRHIRNVNAT
jgi:hypothetical protein